MRILVALLLTLSALTAHADDEKVNELLELNKKRLELRLRLEELQTASLSAFGTSKFEELNKRHTKVSNELAELSRQMQELQGELVD